MPIKSKDMDLFVSTFLLLTEQRLTGRALAVRLPTQLYGSTFLAS